MKTLLTLTILLTTSLLLICCGQERAKNNAKISKYSTLSSFPKLTKIIIEITKSNRVESSHIGEGGSPSEQWKKYEDLKKYATVEQLIELTNNKNPAVRCYSFQALASKKSDKVFSVLLNHLKDTSLVQTQSSCIVMSQYVGDYFIDVVTPNYVELEGYKLNKMKRKNLTIFC